MSHTMNIKLEIRDIPVFVTTCNRLGYEVLGQGQYSLYDASHVGVGVHLPGWKFPVIVKNDGSVAYDDYHGKWGDVADLNKLKSYYGLEKAKLEARRQGYSVTEVVNDNELALKIQVGGGD